VRRGKGEPANKESDWIICGFRYGVQKRDILCPDWFDVVQKSSDEKNKKGKEKEKREKKICGNKAEKTKDDSKE